MGEPNFDDNGPPSDFHEDFDNNDNGYGLGPLHDEKAVIRQRHAQMRKDLDLNHELKNWESNLLLKYLENLFCPLPKDVPGQNVFNFKLNPRLLPANKQEIYTNSNYIGANHFSRYVQIYKHDVKGDDYNCKNPPVLIARTIEQQQRKLIMRGRSADWHMCHLIQVVLSCDAENVDFDNAASCVVNFHIGMEMNFLRRPLLHLLIIDIYNKRSRCAQEVRRLHPNLRAVQTKRLIHMLKLGASVDIGGTIMQYNALQIAVYLNLEDVVSDLLQYSVHRPNLHVLSKENRSSLFELLISGYYFRDPLSPAGPGALATSLPLLAQSRRTDVSCRVDCISAFLICLAHISGSGFINGIHTSQADPIHGKDVKGNSVLDYLQKVHRLSSEFPRDWKTPYMEKNSFFAISLWFYKTL